MAHEKDFYDMDKIPDYAMQPAREDIDTFDPTVYEKLFSELAPLEREEAEIIQGGSSDELAALFERLIAEEAKQSHPPKEERETLSAEVTEQVGASIPLGMDGEAEVAAASVGEETVEISAPVEPKVEETVEISAPVEPKAEEAVEISAPAEPEAEETVEISAPVRPEEEDTVEISAPVEPEVEETVEISAPVEPEAEQTVAPVFEEAEEATVPVAPAVPVSGPAPAKIIPAGSSVISNSLKLTDIRSVPKLRLFIEEDILVPDVKPDLASVLSMEATVRLSENNISVGAQGSDSVKLTGDLMVSTLYMPDRTGDAGTIIAIESRIPFKEEVSIKAEPYSDLAARAVVESIDFTVINERKFKIKATAVIDLKEYRALNLELFEGLRDEEVQMLSETIHLTDVAMRKTESMEISEELPMKDGSGPVGKILCYDVNVVENHKQITAEKAVINGTVYVNAMYLMEGAAEFDPEEGVETLAAEPMLFQGKAEFTQFIKLDDNGPAEHGMQNPVGSKVSFQVEKAELSAAQDEEGTGSCLALNMDLATTLELYRDLETDVVTDVYHHMKEMRYDTREVSVMNLCGSGVAEVSAREIINVPEKYGSVDRVVFVTGRISDVRAALDAGKSVTEGVVSLSMICIAAGENKTPFSLKKEIPFRSAIEIPGIRGDMEVTSEAQLKELWYDKINNRQIEVNAGVLVNTTVCSREKHPLINNVSFVEMTESAGSEPGIILYITREGDNVWRIAKKYRTTIDNIKKINGIDDSGKLKAGTKLLIVK